VETYLLLLYFAIWGPAMPWYWRW